MSNTINSYLDTTRYNKAVENCALDRIYAFDSYMGQLVYIECTFEKFGTNLGKHNVLLKDIKFDSQEINHMWLRDAAAPNFLNTNWQNWYALMPKTVILLSGYVSYYDDTYARKPTLINCNIERVLWTPFVMG